MLGTIVFFHLLSVVLPLLYRSTPSIVSLRDGEIMRSIVDIDQIWKYRDLVSYCWFEEEEYRILVLDHVRDGQLLIGVPYYCPMEEMQR